MTKETDQVRRFYEVVWNGNDKNAISDILHENIIFRGSLGQEKMGHAGFEEYLNMLHEALAEYRCEIEDIVTDSGKVFAKMKFTGVHKGVLVGYQPTNRKVTWLGAALFIFEGSKIINIWVLGDLKMLEVQLCGNGA